MNVLIAEDDEGLAHVMQRNLQAHGHNALVVGTAEAALLRMAEEWPEVLVLDVNLPDYSAWEVLRRLGQRSLDALTVIVISAAPISRKRLAEFQPHGALQKPFPISALLNLLREPIREEPELQFGQRSQ